MTIVHLFAATCLLAVIPLVFNLIDAFRVKGTTPFRIISIISNGFIAAFSIYLFVVGLN